MSDPTIQSEQQGSTTRLAAAAAPSPGAETQVSVVVTNQFSQATSPQSSAPSSVVSSRPTHTALPKLYIPSNQFKPVMETRSSKRRHSEVEPEARSVSNIPKKIKMVDIGIQVGSEVEATLLETAAMLSDTQSGLYQEISEWREMKLEMMAKWQELLEEQEVLVQKLEKQRAEREAMESRLERYEDLMRIHHIPEEEWSI